MPTYPPQMHPGMQYQQPPQPQQYYYGEQRDGGKSIFDDKVAVADVMRYPSAAQGSEIPVDRKMAWAKSTRNYFISKAQEMERVLKWSESFQTTAISIQHIEDLNKQGFCMDHTPGKFNRELWGFLNLNVCQPRPHTVRRSSGREWA